MKYQAKEIDKIWAAVEAQPAKYIRLATTGGKEEISSWNSGGVTKEVHFNTIIKPFLLSDSTNGGNFVIEGRNSQVKKPIVLCEIEKEGEPVKTPIVNESFETIKLRANNSLLSENAEYKYKVKFLEEKIESLETTIRLLESNISELETTISEYETEEEEEAAKPPVLSEQQQFFIKAAEPLLPLLQAAAVNFLSKYLPPDQSAQQPPAQYQVQPSLQQEIPFSQYDN